MIGIIIAHFDDIASCGTSNGARAKLIGKYIAELGNKADRETLPLFSTRPISKEIKRIKTLTVSNFRGFGAAEEFDFSSQYTFYHGPMIPGKLVFVKRLNIAF